MALSYVGYAAAGGETFPSTSLFPSETANPVIATSVSLPAGIAAGDLAIVSAYRDGSDTPPSLPAGWTNLASSGGNTNSMRIGYRVLQGGDTSTGTWTNATEIQVLVLRGQHLTSPFGTPVANGNIGSTITYSAVQVFGDPIRSWVVGFAGSRTATNVNSAVASGGLMANRSAGSPTGSLGSHTQAGVFNFRSGVNQYWFEDTTLSVNASSAWRSYTFEVLEATLNQTQTPTAEVSLSAGSNPVKIPDTLVLDDFNRANVGPPPSSSWGTLTLPGSTGLKVISNQVAAQAADASAYWLTSFNAAQEAFATISTIGGTDTWRGLFLRLSNPTGSVSGYLLELEKDSAGTDVWRIQKWTAGVQTQVGADVLREFAAGDSFWFRAFGDTLVGYHKPAADTSWTEVIRRTDTSYGSGGYVGLYISDLAERIDNFGGGNLVDSETIFIRARKTNSAHTGVMRVQLFEGSTPRSAVLSTPPLTTSFATYALSVAPGDTAAIGNYNNLSLRFNGYSSEGTATTFEVSLLQLDTPEADTTPLPPVFPNVVMLSILESYAGAPVGQDIFPSPTLFPSETSP